MNLLCNQDDLLKVLSCCQETTRDEYLFILKSLKKALSNCKPSFQRNQDFTKEAVEKIHDIMNRFNQPENKFQNLIFKANRFGTKPDYREKLNKEEVELLSEIWNIMDNSNSHTNILNSLGEQNLSIETNELLNSFKNIVCKDEDLSNLIYRTEDTFNKVNRAEKPMRIKGISINTNLSIFSLIKECSLCYTRKIDNEYKEYVEEVENCIEKFENKSNIVKDCVNELVNYYKDNLNKDPESLDDCVKLFEDNVLYTDLNSPKDFSKKLNLSGESYLEYLEDVETLAKSNIFGIEWLKPKFETSKLAKRMFNQSDKESEVGIDQRCANVLKYSILPLLKSIEKYEQGENTL